MEFLTSLKAKIECHHTNCLSVFAGAGHSSGVTIVLALSCIGWNFSIEDYRGLQRLDMEKIVAAIVYLLDEYLNCTLLCRLETHQTEVQA